MEHVKGLLTRLGAFSDEHKAIASACYVLAAALLVVMLMLVGVIPGLHPDNRPASDASTSQRAPARRKPAKPTQPVRAGDIAAKARSATDAMNALLAEKTGVNGATVADQIAPQMNDPDSAYNAADQKLTDLIKQITARTEPAGQAADGDGRRLDTLYDAWQTEVWKAANTNLTNQIEQMNQSAKAGQDYLASHKDYPASCARYAGYHVPDVKGETRADFQRQVGRIAAFDGMLQQCSADMTPAQAAAMPQDGRS